MDESTLTNRLLAFLLSFPFPSSYENVLRNQITSSPYKVEYYQDCLKMVFEVDATVPKIPLRYTLLQGCQILKDNGPIICQLFIEKGHIVQFEVVDLGQNPIDWDYFWSHNPIFDIEYDFSKICCFLNQSIVIINSHTLDNADVEIHVEVSGHRYTIYLCNCIIHNFSLHSYDYNVRLHCKNHNEHYMLFSDDGGIDIICSMIFLSQN